MFHGCRSLWSRLARPLSAASCPHQASVAGVDLLGDRLERLLEARGQDRRAHVGDPERQQFVAMVSKLALQLAVAVHRPRHRVGELVTAEALTE
jgi:hypothetical protein